MEENRYDAKVSKTKIRTKKRWKLPLAVVEKNWELGWQGKNSIRKSLYDAVKNARTNTEISEKKNL